MAPDDLMVSEPGRSVVASRRTLWITLAAVILLGVVNFGPGCYYCLVENKVLIQRLRVDSTMELEIWHDCDWERSSPISYSIKKQGAPRTDCWPFAYLTMGLDRVRVELVQVNGCDVIAIVDALSPKSVFVLIDKKTGDAYPSHKGYDEGEAYRKKLLSRFNAATPSKDYRLTEDFCDAWWESAR